MAQIWWAVAAWRCQVTPVAWRFTGPHSFTASWPIVSQLFLATTSARGKPRQVITVRAEADCRLGETPTAVQRTHRGRRPVSLQLTLKPWRHWKAIYAGVHTGCSFEYSSPTTQTLLFSLGKHLHPLSDCCIHLAYQLFNFSKNRF